MIYIFTGWLADEYFVVVVLHFGLCAQEYHVPCTMYRRPVQFSAGIDVPQTVFIIVLVLNSSLWLIPAGNSNSSTVHEEPPQMRAPPPLMRDHPSWPVEEQFYVYFGTKLV